MPKIVDHKARRLEISATAASLIAKGGLEAATIREIAKASGYSKGVVEHYFDNKEELIRGALNWANLRYEERAEKATRGLSGVASLRARIEAILPLNKAIRDEWKVRLVYWTLAAIQPDMKKRQERHFQNSIDYYERDIAVAIAAGEMGDEVSSVDQARRLLNMTAGICTAALHSTSLYSKSFLLAELDYLLVNFATNEHGSKAKGPK